jgi:splicing factor 3B subunit 3
MHCFRIFQIPRLGMKLKQDSMPLSYTPRKFITHPTNRYFYLIEGDHRVHGQAAAAQKLEQLVRHTNNCRVVAWTNLLLP